MGTQSFRRESKRYYLLIWNSTNNNWELLDEDGDITPLEKIIENRQGKNDERFRILRGEDIKLRQIVDWRYRFVY